MPIAEDKLDSYYAEKLWQWIPEIYRTEDGQAPKPDVLRAIVEVIAEQAAVARRSIDRLHEDSFVEISDDWAVPYIGDLVGTRLVSALNRAGRRVDVAKTIFYRRRKGTPFVLETLIRDIARLDGALVEAFRRLGRMRHGLEGTLNPRSAGRFTRTFPGGWANLRSARGAEIVDGPFDEFAHTPDVRPLSGTRGRYNIPKLNFHLYRLEVFPVEGSDPAGSGQRFTFDPSGRDVPLFMPGERPKICQLAKPWEVRAPIQCGILGHAEYELSVEDAVDLGSGLPTAQAEALLGLVGVRFRSEPRLRLTLKSLDLEIDPSGATTVLEDLFHEFLANAIVLESGKAQLVVTAEPNVKNIGAVSLTFDDGGDALEAPNIAAGNLLFWNDVTPAPFDDEVVAVIDPERGRIYFVDTGAEPDILRYFYGFSGPIGAGAYDRAAFLTVPAPVLASGGGALTVPASGTDQLEDSFTYTTSGNVTVSGDLKLQVTSGERPYVVNNQTPSPAAWVWTASGSPRNLELLGLWVGIDDGGTGDRVLALDGDWDTVTIRHSTLDPGGERLLEMDRGAVVTDPPGEVPSCVLEIRGNVRELVIASSIVGRIRLGASSGLVEKLTVTDSIVQSRSAEPAIDLPQTEATMARVTVMGDVNLDLLDATEVIVVGIVTVLDNQHGCFRFSSALSGSKLPRQFHSPPLEEIPSRVLVSQRFGSPGFAQLRVTAPVDLLRGAENGSEKGAFSMLRMPIRLDSLAIKVDEFKPVGLLPQFILET